MSSYTRRRRRMRRRPCFCYLADGRVMGRYPSMAAAARAVLREGENIVSVENRIRRCCLGIMDSANGYHWRFDTIQTVYNRINDNVEEASEAASATVEEQQRQETVVNESERHESERHESERHESERHESERHESRERERETTECTVGSKFGEFTVIGMPGFRSVNGNELAVCQCSCGSIRLVEKHKLLNGSATSCGCVENVSLLEDTRKLIERINKLRDQILSRHKAKEDA